MIKNNLKSYRAKAGLTQGEVAKKIGIAPNSYSFKENGKREFTLSEAKAIADIFGDTIDKIFFDG